MNKIVTVVGVLILLGILQLIIMVVVGKSGAIAKRII